MSAPVVEESLITYPCAFPIKVMGLKVEGFKETMIDVVQQFDKTLDANDVTVRDSSGGKYLGLTLTVSVASREVLDNVYRALSGHAMVKMVL